MKILIIHTAFIGDIVLSTPLIKKLKDIYPDGKITYVTTPVGATILKNNPYLSEIIEYDKRAMHAGIKGILNLGKRLRYENFNLVITPHRYLRSSILSWLTRAPKRLGYNIASGGFLYTKKIKYDKNKHEVEKLLSFTEKNIENPKINCKIEIYPGNKDIEKIDKIFKDNNFDSENLIVIAPGSKWFTKMWPIEYFNKLIELLSTDNKKIIIVGGKEEKALNIRINKNVLDLRGETTLLESSEIFKRSKIVLTNDSSPIHIASAFEKPKIIGIFGPTVEKFGFFPWSMNSQILENKNLPCRPCRIHGSKSCPKKHFKCMKDITPEMVYTVIKNNFRKED